MKSLIVNNHNLGFCDILDNLDIKKGDRIFLSSDVKRLTFYEYNRTGEIPDLNLFIDRILDKIGNTGSLILPTYNWDFCHGATFDWRKTKGKTGTLGNLCLQRNDFKRTKHPLYSYVVWGQDKDYLCKIDFISSFGKNSVFGFMDRNHYKHIMIDCDFNHAFTFLHYAEEKVSNLCYRFTKKFTSKYIDEYGKQSTKTYTMLVRNLLMDVEVEMTPFENDMINLGIAKKPL